MKKDTANWFLTEASTIGDRLLAALAQHGGADILSGMSGISLFLIGLYKQTTETKYLAAVTDSIDRLSERKSPLKEKYSLYTGLMGVAYTLIQLHEITHDYSYLDKALQIAKNSAKKFVNDENTNDTLFDGRAGCLLTLLHLHAASREKWLLLSINQLIRKIIENMQSDDSGVFWSMNDTNVKAECGFAYGASGIAYVFLELGHYFQNKSFYYIAEEAFSYENAQWSQEKANWPSYRKEILTSKQYHLQKEHFLSGDTAFFQESIDDISYPSGTIGIGLTRARAFHLLNKQVYLNDLNKACSKLSGTYSENDSLSLCDGKAGYGLFFLEAYKATGNTSHLAFALRVAEDVRFSPTTADPSLFKGMAGIGHFYLQLSNYLPSILSPNITGTCKKIRETVAYPIISLGKTEVKKTVLKKQFPRTVYLLEHFAPTQLTTYLQEVTEKSGRQDFFSFMKSLSSIITPDRQDQLAVLFDLECRKTRMAAAISSGAYLHVKTIVQMEDAIFALNYREDVFLDEWLQIDEEVLLLKTPFPTLIDDDMHFESSLFQSSDADTIVLKPIAEERLVLRPENFQHIIPYLGGQRNIMELHLPGIAGSVLVAFAMPQQVRKVVNAIFEDAGKEERAGAAKMAIRYIRHFLKSGILKNAPQ
jgi:Lanthionine synthetase C-like protein